MSMHYSGRGKAALPLPPAFDLVGNELSGAGFSFAADQVAVRDSATSVNNFFGSVADALAAGLLVFSRASAAWGVGRSGYLEQFAAGVPRLVYDPTSRVTSGASLRLSVGVNAIGVAARYTYSVGDIVAITVSADPSRWMMGRVRYHYGTRLVVEVFRIGGGVPNTAATGWVIVKALGYLPEPARSNAAINCCNFDPWSKSASMARADAASVVAGQIASKFTGSGAATSENTSQGPSLADSAAHTLSMVVEEGTGTYTEIGLWDSVGSGWIGAVRLTWATLAVTTIGGVVSASGSIDYGIGPNGGRLRLVWATITTGTEPTRRLYVYPNGQGVNANYTYLHATQIEAGSYFTSLIVTGNSVVTRAADSMTGTLAKLPFGIAEGTMIECAQPPHDDKSGGAYAWQLDISGGPANRIGSGSGNAGQARRRLICYAGGASQGTQDSPYQAALSRYKAAMAWRAGDAQVVANGVAIAPYAPASIPAGLNTLRIGFLGASEDGNYFAAPMESLTYIPGRLSQAEMIVRTA